MGESYSTLAGLFRQYELYYVVADEREVIRVRSNYRQPQEDVYIYRVNGPRENLRRVFLDYVNSINDMRERPRFYNTLTTNCTTSIWMHTRMNPESPPLSWKLLLSGYLPITFMCSVGSTGRGRLPIGENLTCERACPCRR
jgi:hypothetical protein